MNVRDWQPLHDALERLETAAGTPLVPGELERWTTELTDAFEDAENRLRRRIDDVHPTQFDEILEADPGLHGRVDDLRAQDAKHLELLEELKQRIHGLDHLADDLEPHEKAAEESLTTLLDEIGRFVVSTRRQETAISTWLLEAVDRDRGVAD